MLKPGGRFALVFRTNADQAAVRSFPSEVYRFRCFAEMIAALTESGFTIDKTDNDGTEPMLVIATKHGRSRGVS